jgi:hypothetical protein
MTLMIVMVVLVVLFMFDNSMDIAFED